MSNDCNKPIIGLTGGIGAGKSEVARMLAQLGCIVVNSDELARKALHDDDIKKTIKDWWGNEVFDSNGEVNRSKLAAIVFKDDLERKRLESLTHPWIEARRREKFAQATPATQALVIDAPLLVEAGLDSICDVVIFIDAHPEIRLERVKKHRGWDMAELERREAAQLPLDLKRNQGHDIVDNNGDLNTLGDRVREVLEKIIHSHRS